MHMFSVHIKACRKSKAVFPYFWQLYTEVARVCSRGQNIFVHCRAGAHRAGTVCAALGMVAFHYTASEAVAYVHTRRRVTSVTGDNMFLLRCLEKEIAEAWARATGEAAPAAGSSSAAPAALHTSGDAREWPEDREEPAVAEAGEAAAPSDDEADPEVARAPSPPRNEPPRSVRLTPAPAPPTAEELQSAAPAIYDVLSPEEAQAEEGRKWASVSVKSVDDKMDDIKAAEEDSG